MSQIYRYKFSNNFLEELKAFATVHRYDDIPSFREHWETWLTKNKESVLREERILKEKGYDGDINDKMYKSVRYYYKNKIIKEKQPTAIPEIDKTSEILASGFLVFKNEVEIKSFQFIRILKLHEGLYLWQLLLATMMLKHKKELQLMLL